MYSKKLFAILVVAAMVAAMLPVMTVSAIAVPTLSAPAGTYGTTIHVDGAVGDAPAGTVVELYLDDTTIAWNSATGKGKLNSTTAKANGNYEVWFDVPSVPAGAHTLWVKAVSTNTLNSVAFTVNPKVKVSPGTATTGDVVDISFYGFKKNTSLVYVTVNATAGAFPYTGTAVVGEVLDAGDAATTDFTGFLDHKPIIPYGLFIAHGGAENATDVWGNGKLYNATGAQVGTIDYATGEYELTWTLAPPVGNIVAVYQYYETSLAAATWGPSSTTTNALGYGTGTFEMPAGIDDGAYSVRAFDNVNNTAVVTLTRGPTISVSDDATASGKVIRVNGRGWNGANNIVAINLTRPSYTQSFPLNFPAAYPINIEADGTWYADVYVPDAPKVKDDYDVIAVDNTAVNATDGFEITAVSKVTVSPAFGAQGSTITVSGVNYINKADTVIDVAMGATALGTVKTKADGSWTKTFTVPAIASATYAVGGTDIVNGYVASADYKVGNMLIMLNPTKGDTGALVTLTGYGFTANKQFNVTFGSKVIVKSTQGAVSATGTITKTFNIPQLAAGVYTVTVTDVDSEIALTTTFTIEGVTQVTLSPSTAPNLYKVDVTGSGFYNTAGGVAVTYKLYNKTSSGAMDKWFNVQILDDTTNLLARVNATGWINAYWNVDPKATLSKGSYFLEVKDAQGYIVTVPFTVGETHIVAASRKAIYKPGETVSFILEHSLGNLVAQPIDTSYMKVYNPSGVLIFQTAGNVAGDWVKVSDYYVLPYAKQLVGGNPMVLADDAPTGTWTWKWYDANADKIKEGSFEVSATGGTVSPEIAALTTDIANLKATVTGIETSVNAKVDAVKADVAAVKVDIAGVKTAVDTQVAALKTDITGVKSDVAALKTSVSADVAAVKTAVQADVAAVKTDVGALKTSVAAVTTAVTETSNAVKSLATSVATINTAVTGAKTAADNANAAVGGLQTLVYGAIGASLIAAAAAIVALMQISRKIA